jgi:hypothetical protein
MGLFPCTLITRWRSVLLSVALGLCFAVHAGSKIEFSVPENEVEVPDWQKEIKQDAKNALKAEIDLKGAGPNFAPPVAAPVVVARPQDRDPFSNQKDKGKVRNGDLIRPEDAAANPDKAAQQFKAVQAARSGTEETISSSSWQIDRRSGSGRTERDSQNGFNPAERSVGWSTLFKDAQEERDRKEQTARLNDFRALYETQSSMAPIGTPSPGLDPLKQSLWNQPGMDSRNSRTDFMSRRDDQQYGQSVIAPRNDNEDAFTGAQTRAGFNKTQIEPIREFERHRGVLEMPKRPGDLLK